MNRINNGGENLNKKIIAFSLILVSIISITFSSSALNESISWFTDPKADGQRPQKFANKGTIDKYSCIYLGDEETKNVYLTFDAGYENGNVEKTLDILKSQNVKGAFFVLPHFIKANPGLINRMITEGHLVCNHSTSHRDMSKINDFETFKKEISEIETLYKTQTGKDMAKYFRPPEGRFSEKTLQYAESLGYKTVFWSIAYADWDNKNQMQPEKAMNLLLSRLHNGAVILLHPTSDTNAKMLGSLITKIKEKGYTFSTLDNFK